MGNTKSYYEKPAENWNEALPVGNGRLGAMIFGRVEKELCEECSSTLPYEELKKRHIADYRKLFDRVSFSLDSDDRSYEEMPTDKRP